MISKIFCVEAVCWQQNPLLAILNMGPVSIIMFLKFCQDKWHLGHFFVRYVKFNGIENENVEPTPGSESTQISPLCFCTIFLQIARPMPVPGYSSRV